MKSPASLVWLFDVDGTLLTTDGAARRAFASVVSERFGVEDDLAGVAFAGRTDPLILGDILVRHGRTFSAAETADFWDAVISRMDEMLRAANGRLLPGVPEVLDAVEREPGWVPALLTGNTARMARVKLTHFGIFQRFEFGAFGDDGADRNAIARLAVARAGERYGVPPARCVVVGDTELDIECARAAGAHVVAVATGVRDRALLASRAPDLLLDDLTDPAPLFGWARAIAARR
jgi:phosphoglycolate phosphatase